MISTKANTLFAMKNLLKKSRIEEMYILKVDDFLSDKERVCTEIMEQFQGCRIVVRSSSTNEDARHASNAGHYKSILDVDSASRQEIIDSVQAVIQSYRKDMDSLSGEQVLIQRQALDVSASGVVFTRDLRGNRPYYLVNYDDHGSTDSVTSGRGGKMLWIARDVDIFQLENRWRNLIAALKEVENIIEGIPLDIEFAITSKDEVILFQVRPLAASCRETAAVDDYSFFKRKNLVRSSYEEQADVITGKPMKLSDMAFWNPSEMIGSNPKELDYSLYREIITHRAWNEGISELGYRRLEEDLMYRVGNKPYINLTYSFYALIPMTIPESLALRLIHYYEDRLEEDLSAHDKIEFEIAFSSYDFMTEKNTKRLLEYGFTEEERRFLTRSLRNLTNEAILNQKQILQKDLQNLKQLNEAREEIEKIWNRHDSVDDLVNGVNQLLDMLCINGTPQFSRQARLAFIARAFLRTLAEAGYFTKEETDDFMLSVSTVSSEFNDDFQLYSKGKLTREEFNRKYGHLRSGTYDIRTERYDAMNFRPASNRNKQNTEEKKHRHLDRTVLAKALREHGIQVSPEEFETFLTTAIEQREYFKFEFTKSLSLILEMVRSIGSLLEIRLEELSWLSVEDFRLYEPGSDREEIRQLWIRLLRKRRQENHKRMLILLPEVVLSSASLDIIPVYEARPNFITGKRIEGEVVLLDEEPDADISGKIVVVPKADPGYEWIFTKKIRAFITKYGGAASHMAIRCAEFDIPAAIGCGEKIYESVSRLDYLEMDCRNGIIKEGIQYKNLHALISQREGVNDYGDPTDVLEVRYIRFYELLGFIPKPVSNSVRNLDLLFEDEIDLLIVVGGGALDPSFYDRPHTEKRQPHRDRTEARLIHYCVEHHIPIIATCRGMQYVNYLFGGRLSYHPALQTERERGRDHEVYLPMEDRTIMVNNYHSDVIFEKDLAPCFTPLAIDRENGVIEAFGSEDMKLLALQWHPERRFETAEAEDETRKIVRNFISRYIH